MAGTTAAVDFLAGLAGTEGDPRKNRLDAFFTGLEAREAGLFSALWSGLESIPGVQLYGPPPSRERAPTLSFTVEGIPAREVSSRLADHTAVYLSHGDFYAATVVDRLGQRPHGLVRAGISLYTTQEEVERLVQGVERVASGE
jgi:selenocysteine lyase/cysteine desulfurase